MEDVVGESEEETGFGNVRIPNQNYLEKLVVIVMHRQ